MSSLANTCPSCLQPVGNKPFYKCENIPVNSVILCHTEDQAITLNRGDISLVYCHACGFIFNMLYDQNQCVYNQKYEETQTHSNVFNIFNHELASHLLESYQLRNKTILEIGCGKGDFLNLICNMGNNNGIGYDPSYVAERAVTATNNKVTIYNQFFPDNYDGPETDCIICKMTLEHIPNVHDFLRQIHKSIATGRKPIIFFQVPNTGPILEESRFWDIYYEHCSYFTRESLATLFQQNGFQVLDISGGYDRQYLMIEAVPMHNHFAKKVTVDPLFSVTSQVESFVTAIQKYIPDWQNLLYAWHDQNKIVILWGGGSKAVAFLTTLKISSEVHSVVDINPHKQNKYLPGTGHRVIEPKELISIQPDIILAMNPVYIAEIQDHLHLLKIECELFPLSNESMAQNLHS